VSLSGSAKIGYMLNAFPDLLSFGFFSPFILRVVLGLIFVNLGYLKMSKEKQDWENFFKLTIFRPAGLWIRIFAILEILGGLMLLVGIYTQIISLFFVIISLAEMRIEKNEPSLLKRNFVFYLLLFSISLSLLFSGAGIFALDLPL